jgi:hypothetical protein
MTGLLQASFLAVARKTGGIPTRKTESVPKVPKVPGVPIVTLYHSINKKKQPSLHTQEAIRGSPARPEEGQRPGVKRVL